MATGTGATGWCRPISTERHSPLPLATPSESRLAWFVREAWPSPATGTGCTEGELRDTEELMIDVASERLVAFGDGTESDSLALTWGQRVVVRRAARTLRLVVT